MSSPRRRAATVFSLLVLVGVLSGCATMSLNMGIRPDEPPIIVSNCPDYEVYAKYAQELQVSYHSRATQNRAWLYVAGILGLGVMAASGGLAVASTAAAGTLGLLSISGGFAASSFAVINNEALAVSYTVAANSIDKGLRDSRALTASCVSALSTLVVRVSDARTNLEVARTDNAAGALARAKDQLKLLKDQIAAVQEADPTVITVEALIINVVPAPDAKNPLEKTDAFDVTLTVRAKLGEYGTEDLKVALAGKDHRVDSIAQDDPITFKVKFKAPANKDLPASPIRIYQPELIVKGKTRVKSAEDVMVIYK